MEKQRTVWTCVGIMLVITVFSCFCSFVPKVPAHCEGQNICEEALNYPHDLVERIINDLESQGHFLYNGGGHDETENSERPEFQYIDLCSSKSATTIPLAARSEQGQWQFVLNRRGRPLQILDGERCVYENATCGTGVPDLHLDFQMDYGSRCRQEYVERVMTVLNKRGEVVLLHVPYFSCCNCVAIPPSTTASSLKFY